MTKHSKSKNELQYENELIIELRTYDKLNNIKKQNEEHLKECKLKIGKWLKMHSLKKHKVQLDKNLNASIGWGTRKTSKCDWDLLLEKTNMNTVKEVKIITESKPFVIIRVTHKKSKNKDVEDILKNV